MGNKMRRRNKTSGVIGKVEEKTSKSFDALWAGLVTAIILGSIFLLAVFGKLGIYVYKTTGSILYGVMIFIIGIIVSLVFSGIFLVDCDCKLVDYLMYLVTGFIIIEMILGLIALLL